MDEQLRRSFLEPGSAAWSVHADALQARGDPRGELIAVELALDRELPDAEREALEARAARLRAPYVEEFERRVEPFDVVASWRFGYLQRVHVRRSWKLQQSLSIVLDAEHSRFLAELRADFYPKHMPTLVDALAASPRPIQSLRIDTVHARGRDEPIPAPEVAALMHALPHLRTLDLAGRLAFEQLEHPTLERLRLSGHDAILELPDAALPRLRELDLALVSGWGDDRGPRSGVDTNRLAALFDGPATARLRSLDLSRNNPGACEHSSFLGGREPGVLFEVLARTSVCGRLEQLILPSANEQIRDAREQLAKVPTLRMPRLYSWFSDNRARLLDWLPSLEIGQEYPHRPSGIIDPREQISATLVDDSATRFTYWISAHRFACSLEHHLEDLTPAAQVTLGEFSERFAHLAPDGAQQLELELPRFRNAFAELVTQMTEDPGNFLSLLGMLLEQGDRCPTIIFERVFE